MHIGVSNFVANGLKACYSSAVVNGILLHGYINYADFLYSQYKNNTNFIQIYGILCFFFFHFEMNRPMISQMLQKCVKPGVDWASYSFSSIQLPFFNVHMPMSVECVYF